MVKQILYNRPLEFQTLPVVADYMASLVEDGCKTILEPTPGIGNLVRAVKAKGAKITAPKDFWKLPVGSRFDWAIMNPPFTPMVEGFRYLKAVMEMTDNITALLPWFILINSQRRIEAIMDYGLVGITHLPRKTFPGCRIQCCVLEMKKGFIGVTKFKKFDW